jgi:phage N-6-adenine-methyltransferase
MLSPSLFSSDSQEWTTPQDFFDSLDAEFHFTLDPCATPENAKCKRYFTKADDGLKQQWTGRVFMNPPYGREIGKWVKKAYEESQSNAEVVVCLLPARTDTRWWHDYCLRGDVHFIKGRLKFGKASNAAPFPSVIALFPQAGSGAKLTHLCDVKGAQDHKLLINRNHNIDA